MAKVRIGFSTHFEVENEKVGIGTDAALDALHVTGNIIADGFDLGGGITTITTYDGFIEKDASLTKLDSGLNSKLHALSGEIVIDGEVSVSAGTTLTSGPENLTVTDNFTLPGISDDKPTAGTMRFNEDLGALEFYTGVDWKAVGSYVDMGRGRCLCMGGQVNGTTAVTFVNSLEISTFGNSTEFGNLNSGVSQSGGAGNAVRAINFGGSSPGGNVDYIQYGTIATTGEWRDFGETLSSGRQTVAAVSTSTRAVATAGATGGDTVQNILEFVEIMTTGTMEDFGDLITKRRANGAFGSPTRGVVVAGCTPTIFGNIEFFCPQSKGNAADWGDMDRKRSPFAFSNSVRGIIAGGYQSPSYRLNSIDYLTIASAGTNVSDFGDLTVRKDAGGSNGHSSNHVRGLLCGGYGQPASADINIIDAITIATTGNAVSFGEMSADTWGYVANTTDSHGGLGGF